MKQKLFGLMLLFGLAIQLQAQAQDKEKPNFPPYGIGIANGYTAGELSGQKFNGYAGQFRFIRVFNSYPPTFLGVDAGIARLQFKEDFPYNDSDGNEMAIQDLKAGRYTLGLSAGFMIPLDLFIQSKKIPRGAGPSIIVGYNFLDEVHFGGFEEKLNGQGFKFNAQMPLPISQKIFMNFQFEYYKTFYENSKEFPVFLEPTDLTIDGWSLSFQIGFPLGKKR